ncbi:hypothetical protein ACFSKM_14260 [Ancylobacter dichloromethanicus]
MIELESSAEGYGAFDVWANDMTGDGGLELTGDGILVLAGESSYSGEPVFRAVRWRSPAASSARSRSRTARFFTMRERSARRNWPMRGRR